MTDNNNRDRAPKTEAPAPNPPTHIAKTRIGRGDTATFERIGVAWAKEGGAFFVRLHGTQIVADGFMLYPVEDGGAR